MSLKIEITWSTAVSQSITSARSGIPRCTPTILLESGSLERWFVSPPRTRGEGVYQNASGKLHLQMCRSRSAAIAGKGGKGERWPCICCRKLVSACFREMLVQSYKTYSSLSSHARVQSTYRAAEGGIPRSSDTNIKHVFVCCRRQKKIGGTGTKLNLTLSLAKTCSKERGMQDFMKGLIHSNNFLQMI